MYIYIYIYISYVYTHTHTHTHFVPFFRNAVKYVINDKTFLKKDAVIYIYIYIYIYMYIYIYIYKIIIRGTNDQNMPREWGAFPNHTGIFT